MANPSPHAARTARGLLLAAVVCAAAGCAQGPRPAPPAQGAGGVVDAGIVSVTHADPAGFSDGRGAAAGESGKARQAWLDALCLYLSERAAASLPEGERLEVHITDIQRAGGYEPWRGPQAAQVRIVRDIYPPRIDLEFKRLASDGRVLASGRRALRDPAFMARPDLHPNDPLRHEKALLDDWLRKEFR